MTPAILENRQKINIAAQADKDGKHQIQRHLATTYISQRHLVSIHIQHAVEQDLISPTLKDVNVQPSQTSIPSTVTPLFQLYCNTLATSCALS